MSFRTGDPRIPEFPWGPVVKIHEIQGLPLIVEHHPQIFANSCGTGKYDYSKVEFTLAIPRISGFSWESSDSLNDALMAAICYAETDSTRAFVWIKKLLAKESL